jgi:hypothetical protein
VVYMWSVKRSFNWKMNLLYKKGVLSSIGFRVFFIGMVEGFNGGWGGGSSLAGHHGKKGLFVLGFVTRRSNGSLAYPCLSSAPPRPPAPFPHRPFLASDAVPQTSGRRKRQRARGRGRERANEREKRREIAELWE